MGLRCKLYLRCQFTLCLWRSHNMGIGLGPSALDWSKCVYCIIPVSLYHPCILYTDTVSSLFPCILYIDTVSSLFSCILYVDTVPSLFPVSSLCIVYWYCITPVSLECAPANCKCKVVLRVRSTSGSQRGKLYKIRTTHLLLGSVPSPPPPQKVDPYSGILISQGSYDVNLAKIPSCGTVMLCRLHQQIWLLHWHFLAVFVTRQGHY